MDETGQPVAIVTGAGRGIGRSIAMRLATQGAAVVVNDVDDVAEKCAAEIEAAGGRAVAVLGSVADSSVTDAMIDAAEATFGRLDMLVNNAGISRDRMLHRMSDEEWDAVVDVALRGSFNACRSAARLLRVPRGEQPTHNRKVVNIASINGIYGVAGNANYSAAKGGVIGLSKALAREWAGQRINVNVVAPGYIAGTRLTGPPDEETRLGMDPEIAERLEHTVPIGRTGTPDDVAATVAFLCSPDSDYLTGQVIEVHGGMEIVTVTD